MADDTKPRPTRQLSTGCSIGFVVDVVAMLVGFGLATLAMAANAPWWVQVVALFGPPTLTTLILAAIYLPPFIREARETARNAPSPESKAAKAHGEGVEAGTKPSAAKDADSDTPTVPSIATAPGSVLAHGLPRDGLSPGCQFGCAVFMAIFWNAIVSIFVVKLVGGWNQVGWFKWAQAAFLVPFVVIGLVLLGAVVGLAFKWVVSGLVGRVEVEVSAHPLVPGVKVRVRVAQRGLVPLGGVAVHLVCSEEATYVAGTSTSTAKKEMIRHRLTGPDDHAGPPPLEFDCVVPADAMHSFAAPNNKIKWTVRVAGRVLGLPFREEYSVVISPE